jgi:hypothetical protein
MMKQFNTALDDSAFTLSDFIVSFPESGKIVASAVFLTNNDFSFQITHENEVYTVETPGVHFWSERNRCSNVSTAVGRIGDWCKNVRAEIQAASPIFDEFDKLREDLKAKIAEHEDDLKGHFTREEADSLGEKFDELVRRFEELNAKNEITEYQLEEIRRDMEALKENAKTFEKGAFFQTAGNKIFNVCRRIGGSAAAKTVAIEAAKEVTKLALQGKLTLPH